ncbi:hypothetical protein [Lyngbya sp. PCC 8106]|uniref:hypothetical protein n=1 Tax=Lyngbya sp. (strain PCC 8106) TaxID=313612 RepID=UPI0000EA9804|nr:hypothetical protein [Lyngbya sp. PCC 8106]EAW36823.1 hypothetical protein L8106_26717 [Lyngbya sp. PCC 8106]
MIIHVPSKAGQRKKYWRRVIDFVDLNQTTGYAFQGYRVEADQLIELEIGNFLLTYDEIGSMKRWYPHVCLYQVRADIESPLEERFTWRGKTANRNWNRSWALSVRDPIAEIVNEDRLSYEDLIDWDKISTDRLKEELKRRGVV